MNVFECIRPSDYWVTGAAVAIWGGAWAVGYQGFVGTTTVILIPILLWATRRGR